MILPKKVMNQSIGTEYKRRVKLKKQWFICEFDSSVYYTICCNVNAIELNWIELPFLTGAENIISGCYTDNK